MTGGLFYNDNLYFKDDIYQKAQKQLTFDAIGGVWIIDGSLYFGAFQLSDQPQEYYDAVLYRADLQLKNITQIYKTTSNAYAGYYSLTEFSSYHDQAIPEFTFDKYSNSFYILSPKDETNIALLSIDINGQNEKNHTTVPVPGQGAFIANIINIDETNVYFVLFENAGNYQSQQYHKATGETTTSDAMPAAESENIIHGGEEFLFAGLTLLADKIPTLERRTITEFDDLQPDGKYLTGYLAGVKDGKLLVDIVISDYSGGKKTLYYLCFVDPATGEKETIYQREENE